MTARLLNGKVMRQCCGDELESDHFALFDWRPVGNVAEAQVEGWGRAGKIE
jgi:hypothetical protein